jgi:hypothetical protein
MECLNQTHMVSIHSEAILVSLPKLVQRLVLLDLDLLVCLSLLMRAQAAFLLLLEVNNLERTRQHQQVKLVKLSGQVLIQALTILIIGVVTTVSKLPANKALLTPKCKALSDTSTMSFLDHLDFKGCLELSVTHLQIIVTHLSIACNVPDFAMFQ